MSLTVGACATAGQADNNGGVDAKITIGGHVDAPANGQHDAPVNQQHDARVFLDAPPTVGMPQTLKETNQPGDDGTSAGNCNTLASGGTYTAQNS